MPINPIDVQVFREMQDVPSAEWDSLLSPDEIQQSHRFILLTQESEVEQTEYWFLMLRQNGHLCGTAVLTRMSVPLDVLANGFARSLVSTVRRFARDFLRVSILFCGLPVSTGQSSLRIAPWADAASVVRVLVATILQISTETNTKLICLKEFTHSESLHLSSLTECGFFRAPTLPSCSMPVVWQSFADYLKSMKAGYRRQIHATLAAGQRSELRAESVCCFAQESGRIHDLYLQVMQRARYQLETLPRPFFDRLNSELGNQSSAILIRRADRLLAAGILLQTTNVTTFLLTGLDYKADPSWQVYPNLMLEIISAAIKNRSTRLELGQTSMAMKSRFGAVESSRCFFLHCRIPSGQFLLRRCSTLLFPTHDFPQRRVFRDAAVPHDPTERLVSDIYDESGTL